MIGTIDGDLGIRCRPLLRRLRLEGDGTYLFFRQLVDLLACTPCLQRLAVTMSSSTQTIMNFWGREGQYLSDRTAFVQLSHLRMLTLRANYARDASLVGRLLQCIDAPGITQLSLRDDPFEQMLESGNLFWLWGLPPSTGEWPVNVNLQPAIAKFRHLISFSTDLCIGTPCAMQFFNIYRAIGPNLKELILPYSDLVMMMAPFNQEGYVYLLPRLTRLVLNVRNRVEPCLSLIENWAAWTAMQRERLKEVVIWCKKDKVDWSLIPEVEMRIERLWEGGLTVVLRDSSDMNLEAAIKPFFC
jgi:hypothetical protein